MSVVAIGPALDLDGPLPVAPEYRLLSVPGVLVEGGGRWENGVNVWGYPMATPSLWDPCSAGTYREKLEDSDWVSTRFDPFVAYLPFTCSTITANPAEFARRAEVTLEATLSFGVEEALSQGTAGSTNPYFGDANLVQIGADGLTPGLGLNYLEWAIGATGRTGIIHATPAIVSAWTRTRLVTRDEGTEYLSTVNGTPVVSGGGYSETDPVGQTAGSPATGTEWAFATGPVRVLLAPFEAPQISEFVDRSNNTATYRAERSVLAYWDTSLQAGVLINWTL